MDIETLRRKVAQAKLTAELDPLTYRRISDFWLDRAVYYDLLSQLYEADASEFPNSSVRRKIALSDRDGARREMWICLDRAEESEFYENGGHCKRA